MALASVGLTVFALTASHGALLSSRPLHVAAHSRCVSLRMCDGDTFKCDVRKLPKSAIALDITVPAKVSNEIHLKSLAKLAKNARVPGFRDGKVPPQAVIAKLGIQKVKEATVEQIVDVGMQQSGVGQRIQTVGEARLPEELEVLAGRYKPGEGISFSVEVDIYPQCPLEDSMYKGLSVDVDAVEFNQEAYDNALMKLRRQHADIVPVGAGVPAVEGNQVLVDMNGFLANPDGTAGEALPAVAGGEDVQVPLEPGKFMPGLVEGLVGACDGETREITVTFPPRSSVPQLAGKAAIFKVHCKAVQRRELPDVPSDAFADKVKSGMSFAELDAKLREGVQQDAEEKLKGNTHRALQKALVDALPESFEVPETLIEDVTKERFATMLADMREQGATDQKLKEIVTQENYERYKKISRPMVTGTIKGDLALKAVSSQQGLSVPEDQVDDEIMTLQAQALQRGDKFKESEVRPKVRAALEKTMVLGWLASQATVTVVEPKEFDPTEVLGATPEELAQSLRADEVAAEAPVAEEAPVAAAEKVAAEAPVAAEAAEEAPVAADGEEEAAPTAPTGYEWGQTF